MKPIRLIMDAFISYDHAEIDFEAIGPHLYLISGKTGAGKTAIFDAMMYALFGEVSGDQRSEEMLHSSFCDVSKDTVVDFTFEEGGVRCRVRRVIHNVKDRATGQYGKISKQVEFYEGDKPVIEQQKNVDPRIRELLHMTHDQFRQIVMLAQGEFRKFLDSKAGDRVEILRRLFNTNDYSRFEEILKNAATQLERGQKDITAQIAACMDNVFRMPEELTDAEKNLYDAMNPALTENLGALAAADAAAEKAAAEAEDARKAEMIEAEKRITKAEAENARLDALEAAEKRLIELSEREESMRETKRLTERAERAVRRVLPEETALRDRTAKLAVAEGEIRKNEEKKSGTDRVLSERGKQLENAREGEGEIERLTGEIRKIADSMGLYEQLKNDTADFGRRSADAQQMTASRDDLRAQIAETEKRQAENEKRLSETEGADGVLADAQAKLTRIRERAASLETLRADVVAYERDKKRLNERKAEYETLLKKTAALEQVYDDRYKRFMYNQAGLLSADLAKEITENGSGVCPVCGTAFTHVGESFAHPEADAPDEASVDRAKREFDESDKRCREVSNVYTAGKTQLAERGEQIRRTAEGLGVGLTSGEAETAVIRAIGIEEDAFRSETKRKTEAEKLTAERETLHRMMKADADRLPQLRESEKNRTQQISEAEKAMASLRASIAEIRKQLRYSGQAEAEAVQREMTQKRAALQARIDAANEALRRETEAAAALAGKLNTLRENRGALSVEVENKRASFENALFAAGFADETDYREALLPIGGADPESWLAGKKADLNAYRTDCESARRAAEERRKEAEGLSRADMTALAEMRDAAQKRADAAAAERDNARDRLNNHSSVLRQVAELNAKRLRNAGVVRRMQRLSAMANGENGAGGRRTFENYVLAAGFREIIDTANERLSITSNGRYELVYREEADRKNDISGLDMEIIDHMNDRQRRTGSISGGEGFQVSMALALGLSDVVQRHTGRVRIESMFIDEGFGSLDAELLENAIRMLNSLAEENKQIGIISHVERLEECISPKLVVEGGSHPSTVRLVR